MFTKIHEIDPDKLVLIRWRDIVELKDGLEPRDRDTDDLDAILPVIETPGKVIKVARGIAVVKTEWQLNTRADYAFEGHAGCSTQLVPVGCIDAIYEIKIGKKIYAAPKEEEKTHGQQQSGGASGCPASITNTVPN